MSLVYIGSVSLAALVPSVYLSIGKIGVALNAAFNGNLDVSASFTLSPPDLSFYLAGLAQMDADLTTSLSLGLPNVSFDVSAAASLVAELELSFGLLLALEALLNAAIGIYAFGFVGLGTDIGAAVTTELATQWPDGTPSGGTANAMLFGATSSIAQSQMALFLDALIFGSGLVYAGKLTLALLSRLTFAAIGQGDAAISAQLDAALQLSASLDITPPSLAADIEALLAFQASLVADAAFAVPKPSFAIDATASIAADLDAKFSGVIALGSAFNRVDATLFVYSYSGPGNDMGADITSALATTWGDGTTPTAAPCTAALLGATDTLTWSVMGSFFGGAI
jgi:hypothetical protein